LVNLQALLSRFSRIWRSRRQTGGRRRRRLLVERAVAMLVFGALSVLAAVELDYQAPLAAPPP
jgi:hypothetical protein